MTGVVSAHRVQSRGVPGQVFLDLHIQLLPVLNVVEAYDIPHRAMDAVREAIFGIADGTIHTKPALPEELDERGRGEEGPLFEGAKG